MVLTDVLKQPDDLERTALGCFKSFEYLPGAVGAPVVDEDDLKLTAQLRAYLLEAFDEFRK
jgi:hypothetical protein